MFQPASNRVARLAGAPSLHVNKPYTEAFAIFISSNILSAKLLENKLACMKTQFNKLLIPAFDPPKRALRFMCFADRCDHAIPLFLHAKTILSTFCIINC